MNYYNEQDGLKYVLQCRCNGESPQIGRNELPNNRDRYIDAFHYIEEKMNNDWHPNVTLGAAVNGDGLLTDHGIQHVQDVIRHAFCIIDDIKQLTGYEIFFLLVAIHFHDVGNIYGREDHEQQIVEIMDKLDEQLPLNNAEKEMICAIATAHGGYYGEDKDTIKYITSDNILDSIIVRPKVLAAILRYADEISDDLNRTLKNIQVPPENEAYHEYSKALQPISVSGNTLLLHYQIPYDLTQRKVTKGNKSVYLYDEIKSRIAKCMRELEYCKKYTGSIIKITSVSVTIRVLQPNSTLKFLNKLTDTFRLTIQGYPDTSLFTLDAYREKEDNTPNPMKNMDGETLKNMVSEEVNK